MPSDKSISLADEREIRRRYGLEKAEKMRQSRKEQSADDGFSHGENGQILKGDPTNIEHAIKDVGVSLRLNKFLMLKKVDGLDGCGPYLDDNSAIILRFLIHKKYGFLPSQSVFDQALVKISEENSFHPVMEYLEGLQWDGQCRLKTFLSRYFGAVQSNYTETIGRAFLISMVARIYSPGCKQDYMMILEGVQGSFKSMACEAIAGEWFSDNLPDVRDSKDLSQHLLGKWLIEVGELSAMSRAETTTLKAFITRKEERYRPSYGKHEVRQPRQCVFIGTTNEECYLKDATGGRRFWPVKVGVIDLDKLRVDRDQLFAEAVSLFKAGAEWWPNEEFEAEHVKPQQERRHMDDPWKEKLAEWINDHNHDRVTVWQVARDALFIETARISMRDSLRIGEVLKTLGWKMGRSNGINWYTKKH